jgi:hypothetical protein
MRDILARLSRLESLVLSGAGDFDSQCDRAEADARAMLAEPAIAAQLASDDRARWMDAFSEVEARLGETYGDSVAQIAWLRAYLDIEVQA